MQSAPSLGASPRNFAISPCGRWMLVANEESGTVVVMAIDAASGRLTPTGESVGGMPTAMCLVFVEVAGGTPAAAL